MKKVLSKLFAFFIFRSIQKDQKDAFARQRDILAGLTQKASGTTFGKEHKFSAISNYEDFKKLVPVRDYEALKPYFERVKSGEENVLWPGRPIYLSKTSGTTSGAKYIPLTKDSISNHISSARNALLCYIHETGKTEFVNGKMIFLQGSPELEKVNGIDTGRLSGIVAHHVPKYLHKNRMPSYKTNCIEDWEKKVDQIVEETVCENMSLISGIPPWVQMYFEKLIEKSGQENVSKIFENFSLMVYGGVNFKPYQKSIEKLIGKKIDQVEVYPASEGFIAFQDSQKEEGMLLNVNSGIFFEFIPTDQIHSENPQRLCLEEVELNVNYALILSNNAGLWAYNIGDTVKFISLNPYRIIVTGRIKHFTSAFGEHVIAEEVEDAAAHVSEKLGIEITEFHVAPMVNPPEGSLPHHEWYVELNGETPDLSSCAKAIDDYMQTRNSYYFDLRVGNILEQLRIIPIQKNGFNDYMKSIGKLGGQNKLPRLSNDRKIGDELQKFKI